MVNEGVQKVNLKTFKKHLTNILYYANIGTVRQHSTLRKTASPGRRKFQDSERTDVPESDQDADSQRKEKQRL